MKLTGMTDIGLFADLIRFVKIATKSSPKLRKEWNKIVDKHGRNFAVDKWLEWQDED